MRVKHCYLLLGASFKHLVWTSARLRGPKNKAATLLVSAAQATKVCAYPVATVSKTNSTSLGFQLKSCSSILSNSKHAAFFQSIWMSRQKLKRNQLMSSCWCGRWEVEEATVLNNPRRPCRVANNSSRCSRDHSYCSSEGREWRRGAWYTEGLWHHVLLWHHFLV